MDQQIDNLSEEVGYDEVHNEKKLVGFNFEKKRFLDGMRFLVEDGLVKVTMGLTIFEEVMTAAT